MQKLEEKEWKIKQQLQLEKLFLNEGKKVVARKIGKGD